MSRGVSRLRGRYRARSSPCDRGRHARHARVDRDILKAEPPRAEIQPDQALHDAVGEHHVTVVEIGLGRRAPTRDTAHDEHDRRGTARTRQHSFPRPTPRAPRSGPAQGDRPTGRHHRPSSRSSGPGRTCCARSQADQEQAGVRPHAPPRPRDTEMMAASRRSMKRQHRRTVLSAELDPRQLPTIREFKQPGVTHAHTMPRSGAVMPPLSSRREGALRVRTSPTK